MKPWSLDLIQIVRIWRLQQQPLKDVGKRWLKKLKSIIKNWNHYSWVFFSSFPSISLLSILFPLFPPTPQTYILSKIKEPLQVSTTISQFFEQKEKNQIRERELKEKRTKIKAFQGLPPVSIFFLKKGPYHLLILTTTTTTKTIKSFFFSDIFSIKRGILTFFFLLFFVYFFFFDSRILNLQDTNCASLVKNKWSWSNYENVYWTEWPTVLPEKKGKKNLVIDFEFLNSLFFFSPMTTKWKNFSTSRILQS